eukprot:scaffold84676_cov20-Tisochrysis_lutea.AAC.1
MVYVLNGAREQSRQGSLRARFPGLQGQKWGHVRLLFSRGVPPETLLAKPHITFHIGALLTIVGILVIASVEVQ